MSKKDKTNVMRILDQKKIDYQAVDWEQSPPAEIKGIPVYKTLVTVGKSGDHYVFVIPVSRELDLKKAAAAVDEKNIHMIKEKELLPLTGYVHGGCSPIGMKKEFVTCIDQSALAQERIMFSAGKVGHSVALEVNDIDRVLPVSYHDLATDPSDE